MSTELPHVQIITSENAIHFEAKIESAKQLYNKTRISYSTYFNPITKRIVYTALIEYDF